MSDIILDVYNREVIDSNTRYEQEFPRTDKIGNIIRHKKVPKKGYFSVKPLFQKPTNIDKAKQIYDNICKGQE